MTLRVTLSTGLVTVQDLGRPHMLSRGIPRSGALIPSLLHRANVAVANEASAAGIEISGRFVVEAEDACRVSLDGAAAVALSAGETFRVEQSQLCRARYLALEGGVDVPLQLGSRSTWITAELGGVEGRTLRRGDVLRAGAQRTRGAALAGVGEEALRGPVRILPGPDVAMFDTNVMQMLAQPWRVAASSNRVGTRLEGVALRCTHAGSQISKPLIEGAIEVPPSGMPIVLGPEHPTTGGYPIVAVVATESLDAFFARPLGGEVLFVV